MLILEYGTVVTGVSSHFIIYRNEKEVEFIMKKKTKVFIVCLAVGMLLMFVATSARAELVVSLDSPTSVGIGETFAVDVVVDAVTFPNELIAFGFDVDVVPASFTYNGATVSPAFFDDSALFSTTDVAGSAFPGITDTDILLATLSFTTSVAGDFSVGISSDLLDLNEGLITFLALPSDMTTSVDITVASVPEPGLVLLLGISLIGLVGVGGARKIRQKAVDKS